MVSCRKADGTLRRWHVKIIEVEVELEIVLESGVKNMENGKMRIKEGNKRGRKSGCGCGSDVESIEEQFMQWVSRVLEASISL